MTDHQIRIYGTRWCPDCHRARQVFERKNIPFLWIDIGQDAAAADYVETVNGGYKSVPTILFPDGSTLTEPSNAALDRKLEMFRRTPAEDAGDVEALE